MKSIDFWVWGNRRLKKTDGFLFPALLPFNGINRLLDLDNRR